MLKDRLRTRSSQTGYTRYRPLRDFDRVVYIANGVRTGGNILTIRRLSKLFFDNRIYYTLKKAGSQKAENNFIRFK